MDFFPNSAFPWGRLLAFYTFLLLLSGMSYIFVSFKRKKENLPPGPPKLPIIGNLHQLGKLPHRSFFDLSKKYGPVMMLTLGRVPTIVVTTPESAKDVLKTHDLECCSRPLSYGRSKLSYNLLDVAFGPYNEYWREMRKLCMIELFSVKRVKSFKHIREQEIGFLLRSLAQVSPDTPVHLSNRIFSLTNSVICRISFGGSYDGRQFDSGKKIEEIVGESMDMLSSFWVSDFFPNLGWVVDKLNGMHSRLDRTFTELDAFFERVIDQHLNPDRVKAETQDIVDILLGLSNDENAPFRLTRNHIKAVLMDIFVGAVGTSSLTVVWAMTELIRNLRVMEKVQAEIRGWVGKKPQVEEADLDHFKYLKMVVKETFRLHPPVTLLIARESMRQCRIGGYDVFPKTRILVNAWAIGRDPNTWVSPEEFCPERFQNSSIEFGGNHFELIPFGAGRRICAGMTMGALAVELTLANLLYCFDWKLPKGTKKEDISMEEEGGLTIHKKFPLYLVTNKYEV